MSKVVKLKKGLDLKVKGAPSSEVVEIASETYAIKPTDFIGFKNPLFKENTQHNKLMSNFFAQTEALMMGKSEKTVVEELKKAGLNANEINSLKAFKIFNGKKKFNKTAKKDNNIEPLIKQIQILDNELIFNFEKI